MNFKGLLIIGVLVVGNVLWTSGLPGMAWSFSVGVVTYAALAWVMTKPRSLQPGLMIYGLIVGVAGTLLALDEWYRCHGAIGCSFADVLLYQASEHRARKASFILYAGGMTAALCIVHGTGAWAWLHRRGALFKR